MFSKYLVALVGVFGVCNARSTANLFKKDTCQPDPKLCPLGVVSCTAPNLDSCCASSVGLHVMTMGCDGSWPPNTGCDDARNYDKIACTIKEQRPLLYNDMVRYWPSSSGDNEDFWLHEWNKHGTCVSTLNPKCFNAPAKNGVDALEYFDMTMKYFKMWDIYSSLEKRCIVPTANTTDPATQVTYSVAQIKQALREDFGAEPALFCNNGTLNEVSFYFFTKDNFEPVFTFPRANDTCKTVAYINKY
ncbi:hypothetical protein BB560_006742 [Smittium megazygosporum]|uniref:ribonuclease T2 n=1 Tax=Smittium megazygosporum TaxID=133381 RepID=A0A2T9Y218_9FUNG|nr:hypothetical protein BB560_006742 [Smittium megazygosporum]